MKFLERCVNKYKYLRNKSFRKRETLKASSRLKIIDKERPVVYLMCCPIHPNLGDQAQRFCIERWIKTNYPNHQLVSSCARTVPQGYYEKIEELIKPDDIIIIHSGYLFMNDKSDVPAILRIVDLFKGNKIVIFPQTVNFSCDEIKNSFIEVFAKHPDLVLLCRDFVSYDTALTLFPKNKCVTFPDIVTSLIGTYNKSSIRSGVCFCLRDDKEKLYTDGQLSGLIDQLRKYGCCRIDTTWKISPYTMNGNREKIVMKMIEYLANKKLVITDRYHGTIFSVIANTPVIVLNSTDHKLSSGVQWFPKDLFGHSIFYAKDLDEAYSFADDILKSDLQVNNPNYFSEKYWNNLFDILNN